MRSIWLASAAIIMTTGIAAAQSTSPAPTGAANAPVESSNPAAPPGNMGSNSSMAGPSAMSAPSSTGATGTPAPTGATQAAQGSPNPNISPGNMAPTAPAADSAPATTAPAATMASAKPVHHGMGGMMVPENASADRYLHIASDAIKHHNKGVADDALSHAETRILTRAVPASDNMTDDSPRISAIENARKALSTGDFQTAADDTRQAMHGHMGGMGHMGAMNGPDSTSDQPMPGSPMSTDSASGTAANGK